MGVKNLSSIFDETSVTIRKAAKISDFKDKKMAFDALNVLFQFLSSIRNQAGQSFTDKDGQVTSHLIGILTRNCNLLQEGIKPIYIFDGKSHQLKTRVKSERREKARLAEIEYEKAVKSGDLIRAKTFSQQMNKLTPNMVDDAKKLLSLMGIPVIQAPGEGEAQAAILTKEQVVWGTASQDYDTLMFGSPIMVRNLNFTGKRTIRGVVRTIEPEVIQLDKVLEGLSITQEQLIDIGILLGTDFNPDGVSGIGPKTAFKLIKKHGSFDAIEKNEEKVRNANIPYDEIYKIFTEPNVINSVQIDESTEFDPDKILDFLVNERQFSDERYKNLLFKTQRVIDERERQGTLDNFF